MTINDLIPWREKRRELSSRREPDPFRRIQAEFDRLFEDFASIEPWSILSDQGDFNPRINVSEHDDLIEVSAELPGIEQEDIDVTIRKGALILKGEKRNSVDVEEGGYHRLERRYGSFCRTISLPPETIEADKAEAVFKNGVLTIMIPRKKEPQQIVQSIKVKAA